jgi:transcriptional regulator with XRE-family HTH domain
MDETSEPMSLHRFGELVGCDYTTASRLLSGDRRPSTDLLNRICDAFGLDHGEALRTLGEDQRSQQDNRSPRFAAFLKSRVFEAAASPPQTLAS